MNMKGCSSWSVSNTGQLIIHKNGEQRTMGGLTYVGLAEEVDRIMLKVNRTDANVLKETTARSVRYVKPREVKTQIHDWDRMQEA